MAIERTFSIIKPDATGRNLTGAINAKIEGANLKIIAQKKIKLTKEQAMQFYAIHSDKPFYNSLCEYMSSGPVVVQVLEGENAVSEYRKLMGATNPANAEIGTLRREFGESVERNATHGSDSVENAANEISFFFSKIEIIG